MVEELNVGGVRSRDHIINLDCYWRDQRFAYSGTEVAYRGVHHFHNTATDEDTWEIWKYTYSSDLIVRIEGPLRGSWDDRASLGWG